MTKSRPITRLTVSLEIFVYSFPVVLLCYFSVLAGNYFDILIQFTAGALLGSLAALFPAIYMRKKFLTPVFRNMNDDGTFRGTAQELMKYKLVLLGHPRKEALLLLLRYPLGVGLFLLVIALSGELTRLRFFISLLSIFMVLPISSIFFMFQTEVILSKYLSNKTFADIIIRKDQYKQFSIYKRFLFSLVSIVILPLILFVTIFLLNLHNLLYLENITIHLTIMIIVFFATVLLTANLFAKTSRKTISMTREILERLTAGNLRVDNVPMISIDEIGSVSYDINMLKKTLNEIISFTHTMISDLITSSSRMSTTSQDLSDFSQSTAASLEQISATIEEIAATTESTSILIQNQYERTRALTEKIKRVYQLVKEEEILMDNTLAAKSELDKDIGDVRRAITDTINFMKTAEDDAVKMLDYTGLINDISEKTNLLSLNASIEAARAGESGRGFAVVADEIGKLADSAGENTKGILAIVKKTNSSMQQSSASLNSAVDNFERIFKGLDSFGKSVNQIGELTKEDIKVNTEIQMDVENFTSKAKDIIQAMQEQKDAIYEMTNAVNKINASTQENSSTSEDLFGTSENMKRSIEELKQIIDTFKV